MANEVAKVQKPGPLVKAVMGQGPVPPQDTEATRARMNQQLLDAKTPEELVKGGKAESLKNLLGVPLEVHDFMLSPSTLKGEGPPVFAIVEAVRGDDGSQVIFTTSAENVLLRLAVAKEREWLPLRFKVTQSEKESSGGFHPYQVESV